MYVSAILTNNGGVGEQSENATVAAVARKNHYSWQAKTLLKFLEEA